MRSGRGHGHSAVRDRVRGALCIVFDRRRKGLKELMSKVSCLCCSLVDYL